MALNPVGSGSSLTVSTDTAKVIAAGIAQQAKSLRVTLVGASGMDGAHIKTGTMPTATAADFYLYTLTRWDFDKTKLRVRRPKLTMFLEDLRSRKSVDKVLNKQPPKYKI